MELWKGKRKIVIATAVLLAVMLLFTLISKSVYAYQLPQITVEEARKRSVGKRIRLFGNVSQSREYAVSALPGIKTDAVFVTPGDEIEEGMLLFTLNEADLKEQIAARRLAVKKLEVQIATLQHNQSLADQKKVDQTSRALEDYMDSVSDNNVTLDRAQTKEEQAKQDLEKHLEDTPQITKNSDRRAAEEEYEQWVERGKELEQEVRRLTQALEEAKKKTEEAQKAYEEAASAESGVFFAEETVHGDLDKDNGPKDAGGSPATEEPEEEAHLGTEPAAPQTMSLEEPPTPANSGGETESSGQESSSEESDSSGHTEESLSSGHADESEETGNTQRTEPDSSEAIPESSQEPSSQDSREEGTADVEALKARWEEALAQQQACEAALKKAQQKLEAHRGEGRTKPDFSGEDAEKESWEAQRDALERNVQSANWTYEDSLRQKQKELQEAKRRVDDAAGPENIQDTLTLYQLELSYEKEVLGRYDALLKQGCQILADAGGIVTGVHVSAGNDTPDGAAVVYAAKDNDLKFIASLSKEDKEYVGQGTEGTLEIDNRKEKVTVDYIQQQPDGSYTAELFLPEGMGQMGQNGSFTVDYQSKTYQQCIPVNALYEDNKRYYIYVVRRQQGILGEELAAEKRFVEVQEQGDSYAALGENSLADGEEVILTATKSLSDGVVVRYRLKEQSE